MDFAVGSRYAGRVLIGLSARVRSVAVAARGRNRVPQLFRCERSALVFDGVGGVKSDFAFTALSCAFWRLWNMLGTRFRPRAYDPLKPRGGARSSGTQAAASVLWAILFQESCRWSVLW